MAPPDKSLSQADAKPANSGRRVVRIPFPPKNKFWQLMVEKGWAVEAEGLRKDKVKLPAEPLTPEKKKPVEKKQEVRKLTDAIVKLMLDESEFDELAALASQDSENLALAVHGAIEYMGETSDHERNLADGNCIILGEGLPFDSTERDERALKVLEKIGEPALPYVKEYILFKRADRRKCRKIAGFLASSESSKHVSLLIEAHDALIAIYDVEKANIFMRALEHKSDIVDTEIVKALRFGRITQQSDVALLGVLAKHENRAMVGEYLRYLETHCEFADELLHHLIDFGEASVPTLSSYLDSQVPPFSNKMHALYALEQIGSPNSLPAAFNLIDRGNYESTEWNEAVTAIKKLVVAVGPKAVPSIYVRMQNGALSDSPRTCAYLEYLGALECDESVNVLSMVVRASNGASPEAAFIRERATEALGETGRIGALEPLRGLLANKYFNVAKSAANAIESMSLTASLDKNEKAYSCLLREAPEDVDYGDGEVYKYVVSSVRHKFPSVRATALSALGLSGKPDAVSILISALKDKYPEARAAAATALRNNREERAIKPLIETLGDDKKAVSKAAEHSLLDYHKAMDNQDNDRDIVSEHIISAMRHKNKRVRYAAIKLIEEIGASTAIPVLKRLALEDPESYVRLKALKVLGKYANQNINTYVEALGDSESEIVEIAIAQLQILEGIGERAITAALKSNKKPEVRIGAALALSRSGNPNVLDNLKSAIKDSNKEVRLAAITNIGELTVKLLNMPLERYDEETRGRIRSAHSENAILPLMKLLEDKDSDIQAEAASAIARIVAVSDTDVVGLEVLPHLVGLLRSEDESVRNSVVELLTNILGTCDTGDEVKEYLALVERSSKELRGLLGAIWDKVSAKSAGATEMAREICEEFVRLAKEKGHRFENGKQGPYR